jgi:hypothetical protein
MRNIKLPYQIRDSDGNENGEIVLNYACECHGRYVTLISDLAPSSKTRLLRDRLLRRPRRLAQVSLVLFVALTTFGLLSANARAASPTPLLGSATPLVGTAVPGEGSAGSTETVLAGHVPEEEPASPAQAASTGQAAASGATATQQQPTNVVISVRVNSPGDNGPISQTNVAVAGSGASNSASTTQSGAPGGGSAAPNQGASTGQEAAATATATQDEAGNLVVTVRINSPGNNGAVSQSNVAGATANSGNTSSTTQGTSSAGSAPAVAQQPQAHAPVATAAKPRTSQRRPVRRTPAAAPRERVAAPVTPATAPSTSRAASTPPPSTAGSATKASHLAGASPREHVGAGRSARTTSADRTAARPSLDGIGAGAASALGAITPRTYGAPSSEPAEVSSAALVFALLALLAGTAAFFAWPQLGAWLRVAQPRSRLRR